MKILEALHLLLVGVEHDELADTIGALVLAEQRATVAEHLHSIACRQLAHTRRALDITQTDLQAATAALADPVVTFTAERVQVAAARQHVELLELQVDHYRSGWQTGTEFCEYGDDTIVQATHPSNKPDR